VAETDDKLQKLAEKLKKAAEIFKKTQWEKRALQHELEKLKSGSKNRPKRLVMMEREIQTLRREREEVRTRIEKLIEEIDALTKADPAG
jgi:chromosome segregation ATPase